MDNILNPTELAEAKPFGALKLTIQKFYRINGGSTQIKGVTPDVPLINIYDYIEMGENEQDFAMPWTEIAPVSYQTWNSPIDFAGLKAKSAARLKNDSSFIMIEQKAQNNKKQKNETLFSLNLEDYRIKQKQVEHENKVYENWRKKESGLKVVNLQEDKVEKRDTSTFARNKRWLDDLKKDEYLKESVKIMMDMK